MNTTSRWRGIKLAREVVFEAVHEFTGGDVQVEFEPKDINAVVLEKYPDFNEKTVEAQIIAGCPTHRSYRHYSGNYEYYWRKRKGKYRLYDPKR